VDTQRDIRGTASSALSIVTLRATDREIRSIYWRSVAGRAAIFGFQVAGIDGSASAISYAQKRFNDEGLTGDFKVQDFTTIFSWPDASFDLVIDRGSLTCCDDIGAKAAFAEIFRVLKPGGRAFLNLYSDSHSSFRTAQTLANGLTVNLSGGTLAGLPAVRFWSRRDIDLHVAKIGWTLKSVERLEIVGLLEERGDMHAEFRIIVEKPI
jgi:SAM-dependent methyltransferase